MARIGYSRIPLDEMETDSVDEYLVWLKRNVDEIKFLAKEWQMSEEDIKSCIKEVLSTSNEEALEESPKFKIRKLWSFAKKIVKFTAYIFLAVFALIASVYIATTVHQPTSDFVMKAMNPYAYHVMRAIRLVTLPLHKIYDVTELYESECVVENPFFKEEAPDCSTCMKVKKIKEFNLTLLQPSKFSAYSELFRPFMIKKAYNHTVSYTDLRRIYLNDPEGITDATFRFVSVHPEIKEVKDFFEEDREVLMNKSKKMQVNWQGRAVPFSVAIRKLFPRPSFLPKEIEISLEKHVMFDGPYTPTYELPYLGTPTQIYTLASGSRRVLVRPIQSCKQECNSILVFMEAGDMIVYNRDLFRLYIAANGDQPSVGYAVSYN